jgi:hypothetical protein
MLILPAYGLLETFKKEDLVTTSSGSLICQKIIHVRARNGFEGWKRTFVKSLAEVERLKLSSVSFPAMGTGNYFNQYDCILLMSPYLVNIYFLFFIFSRFKY